MVGKAKALQPEQILLRIEMMPVMQLGHTDSYVQMCYFVWIENSVFIHANGISQQFAVAEVHSVGEAVVVMFVPGRSAAFWFAPGLHHFPLHYVCHLVCNDKQPKWVSLHSQWWHWSMFTQHFISLFFGEPSLKFLHNSKYTVVQRHCIWFLVHWWQFRQVKLFQKHLPIKPQIQCLGQMRCHYSHYNIHLFRLNKWKQTPCVIML